MSYAEFLASKASRVPRQGVAVDPGQLHPFLHDWQAGLVSWSLGVGRAAGRLVKQSGGGGGSHPNVELGQPHACVE